MTRDPFETDLEAVFGERAAGFSDELRTLLRGMWRQGVLAGREMEREHPPLDLSEAVQSECGQYLCVPLPSHMKIPGAVEKGIESNQDRARANPLEMEPEQLMKEILKAAEEMDRIAPRRPSSEWLLARHVPRPRVPTKPNKNGDVFTVEALEGSFLAWGNQTIQSTVTHLSSTPRLKQFYGSWPTPSTGASSGPSGTGSEDTE